MVLLLGMLAAFAVISAEVPSLIAWPIACAGLAWACASARRESRRAPIILLIAIRDDRSSVDGVAVSALAVHWRGPLAFVSWREHTGRIRRLSCWPDVLGPAARRELRLATQVTSATRLPASVAP